MRRSLGPAAAAAAGFKTRVPFLARRSGCTSCSGLRSDRALAFPFPCLPILPTKGGAGFLRVCERGSGAPRSGLASGVGERGGVSSSHPKQSPHWTLDGRTHCAPRITIFRISGKQPSAGVCRERGWEGELNALQRSAQPCPPAGRRQRSVPVSRRRKEPLRLAQGLAFALFVTVPPRCLLS